jgi:hypothetical protein
MYESGEMTKLIEKYGAPRAVPGRRPRLAETRQGVDRPADRPHRTIGDVMFRCLGQNTRRRSGRDCS